MTPRRRASIPTTKQRFDISSISSGRSSLLTMYHPCLCHGRWSAAIHVWSMWTDLVLEHNHETSVHENSSREGIRSLHAFVGMCNVGPRSCPCHMPNSWKTMVCVVVLGKTLAFEVLFLCMTDGSFHMHASMDCFLLHRSPRHASCACNLIFPFLSCLRARAQRPCVLQLAGDVQKQLLCPSHAIGRGRARPSAIATHVAHGGRLRVRRSRGEG